MKTIFAVSILGHFIAFALFSLLSLFNGSFSMLATKVESRMEKAIQKINPA